VNQYLRWGGLVVICGVGAALALGDSPWNYYGEKGGLSEKVQLEIGRSGPDSVREIWAIQPSGEWSYSRSDNKEGTRQGKLTDRQQQALAHHLAAQEFSTLVGSFGLPAEDLLEAEPRSFIILRVGDRRAVFIAKEPPLLAAPPIHRDKDNDKKDKGKDKDYDREELLARKWSRITALSQVIPAILMHEALDKDSSRDKDKK
jgi:hypothetical protein